jgi:hypothetical protein
MNNYNKSFNETQGISRHHNHEPWPPHNSPHWHRKDHHHDHHHHHGVIKNLPDNPHHHHDQNHRRRHDHHGKHHYYSSNPSPNYSNPVTSSSNQPVSSNTVSTSQAVSSHFSPYSSLSSSSGFPLYSLEPISTSSSLQPNQYVSSSNDVNSSDDVNYSNEVNPISSNNEPDNNHDHDDNHDHHNDKDPFFYHPENDCDNCDLVNDYIFEMEVGTKRMISTDISGLCDNNFQYIKWIINDPEFINVCSQERGENKVLIEALKPGKTILKNLLYRSRSSNPEFCFQIIILIN